jgi:hypothetical protein
MSNEEAIGRDAVELIVHPTDFDAAKIVIHNIFMGKCFRGKFPVKTKSGSLLLSTTHLYMMTMVAWLALYVSLLMYGHCKRYLVLQPQRNPLKVQQSPIFMLTTGLKVVRETKVILTRSNLFNLLSPPR